jgi:mannan endo-1,4-beta-mannosidase
MQLKPFLLSTGPQLRTRVLRVLLATIFAFTVPLAASAGTLVGVYYGGNGWKMQQVRDMQKWDGKRNAVLLMFTGWCNSSSYMNSLFTQALVNVWNNHSVPVLTWEPKLCGTTTPSTIESQIANGKYDSYIRAWAGGLKRFLAGPDGAFGTADDRRVYLRFAHEMNGTWYPWSAIGSGQYPWQYVAMWRHVHGILESYGLNSSHVQWVWCVNNSDVGPWKAEQYYPGNAYVDWVGIDGYNWGWLMKRAWKMPSDVFGNMLGRMRNLTAKPVGFMETATSAYTSNGFSNGAKNNWIYSLYTYAAAKNIKMLVYYNQVGHQKVPCCYTIDFPLFGGSYGNSTYYTSTTSYKVYTEYKTTSSYSYAWSSTTTNLRLLSDSVFAGNF